MSEKESELQNFSNLNFTLITYFIRKNGFPEAPKFIFSQVYLY
jgi:hypothetical protein